MKPKDKIIENKISDISDSIKQGKPFRNISQKTAINIIFTGRWLFNLHNELFKTFGLTAQQYNVLRILKGQHPRAATVKLLKERMLDKMSDVSRIVENLRIKGYLSRELNTYDRREVKVLITQKGLDILLHIEEKGSDTMDDFLSNLTPDEAEQLNTLLDKARSSSE